MIPDSWLEHCLGPKMFDKLVETTMNDSNITGKTVLEQSDVACIVLNRKTAEIAGALTCAFIFLASLIGNALVITVVYRNRQMRTIVNLLIVNMAASDFLCTMSVIPKVITQTFTYPRAWLVTGVMGELLCKIAFFFQDVTVSVSLLSLLTIAIERYHATSSRVFGSNLNQRKRCKVMILSTWLVAFLMFSSDFYTFKLVTEDKGTICTNSWKPLLTDSYKAWKIEFFLHTILFVFIPFIVVVGLYTIILVRIRRMPIQDDGSNVGQRRRDRERRNRKVCLMLLIVVLAHGICWFPFIIYTYVVNFGWYDKDLYPPCGVEFFGECALYLTYLNTSINPAIYFALSANFRNGLKNLIHTCSLLFPVTLGKQAYKQVETPNTRRKPRGGAEVGKVKDVELRVIEHL